MKTRDRNLIMRAKMFAEKAHAGLERKTGGPYVAHTTRVAEMLAEYGHAPETVAAGHLHDTVEDTDVTHTDLVREFGERVAALVEMVTDPIPWPYPKHLNRAARKEIERAHFTHTDHEGATIKLADMIDNLHDIDTLATVNAKFAKFTKLYKAEAKLAHPLLAHGDKRLHKRLGEILN